MPPAPPADAPPAARVVVAGVGLITPLGGSAWETFRALLAGRHLTDRTDPLEPDTDPVPLAQAVGGVSVARHTATDPAVELAERATREAATEAGRNAAGLPAWLGTSKGAVHGMTEAQHHLSERAVESFVLGPHGYLSHHLAQRTGVEVRGHTVAACASGLTALDRARRLLLHPPSAAPHPRFALAVTAEAALLPPFIHSYRRLGVLAPMTPDHYRGRPLDRERGGFVLAEAGAAVLLERVPPGQAPRPGQIELLDTAVATEGHDLIRPHPGMPALERVAQRLAAGRPIAAVHPHATGTPEHDPLELRVIARALGPDRPAPALYANKGALGHSLGGSGLVSLAIACLAARVGKLPPMPWLTTPLADAPLPLTANPQPAAQGGHLVLSAGFGGHVAGALVTKVT